MQTLFELVVRINTAANQVLADPDVKDKLSRLGIEPVISTPDQLAKTVADDTAKWKKIIVDRKITSD